MQGERYFLSREAGRQRRSCLCSKNRGLTNVKSMVGTTALSAPYDAPISCTRGDWQDWEGDASNRQLVNGDIISLSIGELV